jgi:hypothetical protein
MPPPVTTAPPVPVALPSLPVGPGGIEYLGSGNEQEIEGPNLLAVDPAGGFHFHDPAAGVIWSFRDGQRSSIDLLAADIVAVTSFAAGQDHLVVVEISFSPDRHRVHRLGYDGTVLETVELPPGFRLRDGLSSVLTGAGGEIVIEIGGGASYGVWNAAAVEFESTEELTLSGSTIKLSGSDIEINGALVTGDFVGFGGLRYLGTAADGSVVIKREDVLQTDPVFRVLSTVEWYSAAGEFLGSSRVPSLETQAIDQVPGVAVARDGSVYALIARDDRVEIIELERHSRRIMEFAGTT